MSIEKKVVVKVDTGDSSNDIDKLTGSVTRLNAEQNTLKENIKELTKVYKDSKGDIDAERDANQKLSSAQTALLVNGNQLRDAKKALSDAAKTNTKEVNAEDGSIKSLRMTLNSATAEYIRMSEAQRNSAAGKEMQLSIKAQSDNLKELEKQIGQNQRSVGDYELANRKLPGIFGEMQSKATEAYGAITSGINEVKGVMTGYIAAKEAEKVALAAAAAAAQASTLAETELAAAEKAGAATAEMTARAEMLRAEATVTATAATEASSKAMKIFKYALLGTGIGLLVIALGAVVTYFTQTNDGAKVFQRIMSGVNAVVQEGVKIMGSFGRVVADLLSGNTKDLAKDWKEVKDNIADAGNQTVRNYQASVYWKKEEQKLVKAERTWSEERKKLEGERNVLAAKGRDMLLSAADRKKAFEGAKDLTEKMYKMDVIYAQRKLKIMEQQEQFESKKNPQKITDQKNTLRQLTNDHDLYLQTLQNKTSKVTNKMNRDAVADAKEALKEQDDARKASLLAIETYEGIKLELLNRIIDSEETSTTEKLKALDQIKAKQDEVYEAEKAQFGDIINWKQIEMEEDGKKVDEYLKGLGLTAKAEEEVIKIVNKRHKDELSNIETTKKIRKEALDDEIRNIQNNQSIKNSIDSVNELANKGFDDFSKRKRIIEANERKELRGVKLQDELEYNKEVNRINSKYSKEKNDLFNSETYNSKLNLKEELNFKLTQLQENQESEVQVYMKSYEEKKILAKGDKDVIEKLDSDKKAFLLTKDAEWVTTRNNLNKQANSEYLSDDQKSFTDRIGALTEGNFEILDIKKEQLELEKEIELKHIDDLYGITEFGLARRDEINAKYAKSELDLYEAKQNAVIDITMTTLKGISDAYELFGGEQEWVGKTLATAEITSDAIKSGFKIYAKGAEYLTAGNIPMFGVSVAEGVALAATAGNSIKKIWSPSVDKSVAISNKTAAMGASGVSQAPIQATQQVLTGTEQQLQNKSRRVILVESDVTDAQNKVKVVQDESSF